MIQIGLTANQTNRVAISFVGIEMPRLTIWRVRVKRAVEVWVDVQAVTSAQAEADAVNLPGVISVFGKSAIRGDEAALPERPAGVREE